MCVTKSEIDHLEALYAGRKPFQGELHDHANTGGTSYGQRTLSHWIGALEGLKMDFAAILDHRQIRHMYQPEWEDGLFIPGTEPGTAISDSTAADSHLHYNILIHIFRLAVGSQTVQIFAESVAEHGMIANILI